MSTDLSTALQTLRDVEGMYGSFIVSANGALVERDVPAVFDDKSLEETGLRLSRIYDTFNSTGNQLNHCQLRFKEHKLYSRRLGKGYLCVLAPLSVNMATLRMALTLVVRRVDPLLNQAIDTMKRQGKRVTGPVPSEPAARTESGSVPAVQAPAVPPPVPAAPPPVPAAPVPPAPAAAARPASVPPVPPRQPTATPAPAPTASAPGRPRGPAPSGLVFRGQRIK